MGAIDDGSASYIIKKVLAGMTSQQITGIPPRNMGTFTVSAGNGQATIKAISPENTIVDDQLLCTVGGVRIMRKAASAPISPEDGTLVVELAAGASVSIVDTGLTNGVTYYYAAFPFSDHGVFNYNTANVRSCTPSAIKYWAFDQDFSNKAPAQTITYPSGFQNSNFEAMLTNEGTGTATAGDWEAFLEETLKNYPAMVNADGSMYKQLDPDDYTKYLDGTTSPYNGDGTYFAGAWLNKIYVYEEYSSDGNSREVQFADGAADGFTPLGFYDFNQDELSGIWLPMAYMNASGKTIISGSTPVASKTADQENTLIKGFSERGVFLGGPILNLLRDLEYMLFKSTDIQLQAGHGRCNAGSQAVINNAVVANGNVRGWKGTSDKKTMNKYFHSQLLGSYQQWIRDPYTQEISGILYVDPYYRYNIGTTDKVNTGKSYGNSAAWYYPCHLQKISDEYGSLPTVENTGSTSTGLCDGIYTNSSGTRVALRLGGTGGDLIDGPASVDLRSEASNASWHIGVGLMLLPAAGYEPDLEQVA